MKNAAPARTTRSDLYAVLDRYLAALDANDPTQAPWADTVYNTENNVSLMVGDGMWVTVTDRGKYDLRFADVEQRTVGFFGSIFETTKDETPFSLWLKVDEAGRICEVESIAVRVVDHTMPFRDPKFWDKPQMNEMLPPEKRTPRARLISFGDGYFDTLQLNDGTMFTKFHPDANRVENGHQTTNNDQLAEHIPVVRLGCAEQFEKGYYKFDDRVRGRRFPVVDEERGLVLGCGFIDHCGKLRDFTLTDGTPAKSPFLRPQTLNLMELFKIKDGAIEQIEANFISVPYHMPSPWDGPGFGESGR
jgi:hypothetical protein